MYNNQSGLLQTNMRFNSQRPIQVQLVANNRVIVLTQHSLYFTHLRYMDSYLACPIAGIDPSKIYYSSQSQQTLVITSNTIEILYSDWSKHVQTRKVMMLNNEVVYGVRYSDSIWKLYGKIHNYSSSQIQIIKVWQRNSPTSCFLGQNQFTIVDRKLYQITYSTRKVKQKEIQWKERLMVTANQQHNLTIVCMYNTTSIVLCIGQRYIIIIKDSRVTKTIERTQVFYFENNVVVSRGRNGLRVDRVVNSGFQELGVTQAPDGILYSACIYQDQLVLMMYSLFELIPKAYNLLITQTSDRKAHQLSFDSFHKAIPQQANESGSQLMNLTDLRPSNKSPRDYQYLDNAMEQEFELLAASEHSNQTSPKNNYDANGQMPMLNNIIKHGDSFEQKEIDQYKGQIQPQNKERLSLEMAGVISPIEAMNSPQFDDLSAINFRDSDTYAEFLTRKDTGLSIKLIDQFNFSEKVIAFSLGRTITEELQHLIEQKKYSYLLLEVRQKKPNIFFGYLQRYLHEVIEEDEASTLFSQTIKAFSISQTHQILSKLYSSIQNTPQNKYKFSKALKDFKLNEVPKECLSVDPNAFSIIMILHPNIFVQDLIQPNSRVFSEILEQYFMCQQLPCEQINIEDELIDITHPRNLLNVLLYLDQIFQVPLNDLFTVYVTKIIRFGHLDIIKKIIYEQNVLEICEVPITVIEKAIQDFVSNFMKDSCSSFAFVREIVGLIKDPLKNQLLLVVSVVESLTKSDLYFSIDKLFIIKQNKTAGVFLGELIEENSGKNLSNINLPILYRKLWQLQEGAILKFYNYELIYLIQSLAEKLIESSLMRSSFEVLNPISSIIKRGFVVKLLSNNSYGKLAIRLINKNLQQTPLMSIYPEIFKLEDYGLLTTIRLDSLTYPEESQCFACSWEEFEKYFDKILLLSSELVKVITYKDVKLAAELVQCEMVPQSDFYDLIKALHNFMITQVPEIPEYPHPNTLTNIPIAQLNVFQSHQDLQTPNSHSQINSPCNEFLLKPKQKQTKSLSFIKLSDDDSFSFDSNNIQARSVCRQNKYDDSRLNYLHIQVQYDAIINCLRQVYQEESRQCFLQGLKIIENKGIRLYRVQMYKCLVSLKLKYGFERVLAFEIFTVQSDDNAFDMVRDRFMSQITIKNFWILYFIAEIVFKMGIVVAQILIQKIVKYQRNDQYSTIVQYLITSYPFKSSFLMQIRKTAIENQLTNISNIIN